MQLIPQKQLLVLILVCQILHSFSNLTEPANASLRSDTFQSVLPALCSSIYCLHLGLAKVLNKAGKAFVQLLTNKDERSIPFKIATVPGAAGWKTKKISPVTVP